MASSFCLSLHVGKMAAPSPASALHSRKDEEEEQEQKAVSRGPAVLQHRLGSGLSRPHRCPKQKQSSVKKDGESGRRGTCVVPLFAGVAFLKDTGV